MPRALCAPTPRSSLGTSPSRQSRAALVTHFASLSAAGHKELSLTSPSQLPRSSSKLFAVAPIPSQSLRSRPSTPALQRLPATPQRNLDSPSSTSPDLQPFPWEIDIDATRSTVFPAWTLRMQSPPSFRSHARRRTSPVVTHCQPRVIPRADTDPQTAHLNPFPPPPTRI